MSRIGNKAITIPAGVEVTVAAGNEVTVKGPKGTLTRQFSPLMDIKQENGILTVARANERKHTKQLHGTTRALINNMIEGCHEGYLRVLGNRRDQVPCCCKRKKLTLNDLDTLIQLNSLLKRSHNC